jgi:hypothetical protein
MKKEAKAVRRMATLNAEANRRLSELWSTMPRNFHYPAEDEIACGVLNSSSAPQPRPEAMPRAFTDFNAPEIV